MDRHSAVRAFEDYSGRYDAGDIMIKLKIEHTYRVADIAERIAKSIRADVDFAWFCGLLHDIARFEQWKTYGTFKDASSVDHAELGADLLFGKEDLISIFPDTETSVHDWRKVCEAAVRYHNRLNLPDGLDEQTKLYCDIIRDADKIDILRVMTEPPYDERNEKLKVMTTPASDEVMRCVREHRCVPRNAISNIFESRIGQCCMGFELVFPESIVIVREQGYLLSLLDLDIPDARLKEQLNTLRGELYATWESKASYISQEKTNG